LVFGCGRAACEKPAHHRHVRTGYANSEQGIALCQSFLDGLRELGNIEGRDFDIIIQPARSTSELPKAAEQLVQLNPDVITRRQAGNINNPHRCCRVVAAAMAICARSNIKEFAHSRFFRQDVFVETVKTPPWAIDPLL
jgi:hypothetical protein